LTASDGLLFDIGERSDPSHARYGEDSFAFMNRVDQPFWERIRDELERWFAEYPQPHAADLRARFRNSAPAQHFPAWWELYLHRLFNRLGFMVEVHPELPGRSARPDFRLVRGADNFLVEAATTFSGIVDPERHGTRENWIMAAIDEARNPDFFVGLRFDRVGRERPTVREITGPLERWLTSLDADEVIAAGAKVREQLHLEVRDWSLVLTAIPRSPAKRGKHGRLLGVGPGMTGPVNDVEMLRRTLERKRRVYGRPNEPIVVAVLLVSGFVDNEDIEQALFGSIAWQYSPQAPDSGRWVRRRNGFWVQGTRARGTRVSAVLTACVMAHNAASVWPRLWPNPWATRPLTASLPFPAAAPDQDGVMAYESASGTPAALLGVPEDWPGPEAPFAKH